MSSSKMTFDYNIGDDVEIIETTQFGVVVDVTKDGYALEDIYGDPIDGFFGDDDLQPDY